MRYYFQTFSITDNQERDTLLDLVINTGKNLLHWQPGYLSLVIYVQVHLISEKIHTGLILYD